MSSLEFPDSHMLVPSCNKLGVIVGIKLNTEDREVTQVPESKSSFLSPSEYLYTESSIHANWY